FEDLFLTVAREDEVLVGFEEVDQPVLVLAEFEEVVALGDLGDLAEEFGPGAVGVAVLFLEELFLARGVEALVFGLVDEALVEELLEDLRDDLFVARLGGAD